MFKKKSLFIFIIMFVFMFIDIKGVLAAKELTCVYQVEDFNIVNAQDRSNVIIQDSNGNIIVYSKSEKLDDTDYTNFENKNATALNNDGWWLFTKNSIIDKFDFSNSSKVDSSNLLTSCPNSMKRDFVTGSSNHYIFKFFDDDSGKAILQKQYNFNSFGLAGENVTPSYSESDIGKGKKCSEMNLENYWLNDVDKNGEIWTNACLYAYYNENENNCIIYQLNYNSSNAISFSSYNSYSSGSFLLNDDFKSDSTQLTAWNGYCPAVIYGKLSNNNGVYSITMSIDKVKNSNKYSLYHSLKGGDGYNNLVINDPIDIKNCKDLLSEDMVKLLSDIKTIMQVSIPLILVALGIVDFAKAVFGTKEDDMKKSSQRFLKRLIIAIIIFFVPSFLEVLLTIASKIWPSIDPSLCGIL